jgi:hypothetical protein
MTEVRIEQAFSTFTIEEEEEEVTSVRCRSSGVSETSEGDGEKLADILFEGRVSGGEGADGRC